MIFTKLRYRNILSTGNQWMEIELNKSKTTLIVGDNGSGKSTILDALSFVLFNKPFRPDFNKPQLVNSINGKGLMIEVDFSIGKKEYKIVRGIKPAIFEVYEGEKLLNQDANIRDYQDLLEKNILKINHRSFCQVVILGSANYTPFMKLDAKLRREVVEDILDLKIFSLMNSILLNKKQQNEISIQENQYEKKLLSQRVELIKQHANEITATNTKLIEDKQERIQSAKDSIKSATTEREHSKTCRVELEISIRDADKDNNYKQEIQQIKYKLENKIYNLTKSIEFFHDNDTCPTCSQEIETDFKCETIIKKQLVIDQASDALVKLTDKLEKVNLRLDEIREVKKKISAEDMYIHDTGTKIDHLQKYIEELESEVKLVESHNKKIDKKELVKITEELADLNLKYNELVRKKNLLELAGIMLKDGGIKAKIIKQYIPIINNLINKYLGMLDFFVKFTIDEEFEEKILSRYRDEFTYGSFSGGEKFRINLALLFTWRTIAKMRNSLNTNILFFDELLDSSLDINGTEEALKILNKTDPGNNIFIISHRVDQMLDKFDHTIKFEKTKNFSKIVPV